MEIPIQALKIQVATTLEIISDCDNYFARGHQNPEYLQNLLELKNYISQNSEQQTNGLIKFAILIFNDN